MVTLTNCVDTLLKDDVIVHSYVYSYRSRKYWRLTKGVHVRLSDGSEIVIPPGFYWDMASVPKWLWSVVRPFNDGLLATLIHDYLYIHRNGWSRARVDKEYLIWMNATNKNKVDNYLRYLFVRMLGWTYWMKLV